MLQPLLLLLGSASLVLSGLAPAAHAGALPVCSAKHKRPASLYGSVLSDGLKPAPAAAPVASAPAKASDAAKAAAPAAGAADAAGTKAVQVSRAELRASFAPCGGDRA